MDVFVVSPCLSFINCTFPQESTVSDLIELFSTGKGVSCLDFYVKKNGRLSGGEDRLQAGAVYRLEPRLCGGKGGFGSMLRALGAQIEKTTNREACRDLSGRRLRDVNHEKEMAEWLKKQTDRDAEKEQRRLEKIRRKLAEPKRGFVDAEFDQQCHDLSERLEDSVLKGMQASSSSLVQAEDKPCRKRPAAKASVASASHSKKSCFWTGLEGIQDMDSTDEESDESEAEGFSPYQSSSSSSASSAGAGPSRISQPAAVLTSTAKEQEKKSHHLQSLPCSSSSSSSSSVCSDPGSPSPSLENRKEEEENRETAQEKEDNRVEAVQKKEEEHGVMKQEEKVKNDEAAQEKTEQHAEMKQEERENIESVSIDQKAEKDKNVESVDPQKVQPEDVDTVLDLLSVSKVEELEAVGLERLKAELMKRGMKCGGTLQERAARLFSVRGLKADQIDPALLAKPSRGKKK